MKKPLRRLHLWIPELAGPGGIQAYSKNLLRACSTLLPDVDIAAVVKNGLADEVLPNVTCRTAGRYPDSLRRSGYAGLVVWTLLRQRPDLVIVTHLHFTPLAYWLQHAFGFRYWVVVHGIEAWGKLTPSQRRALNGAEKILPVSDYTAGRLQAALGEKSAPMERLPNMVDEARFTPGPKPRHLLRRYGFTKEHRILLTVARLDPRQRYKGYDLVLDAMALLRNELPTLRYVIAGRGKDSGRVRRRIIEMGLEAQVILTGFLPEQDLPDHYNLCDLFVMPSQAEGFGIVFLEALACGRAVVAGNSDGSAEPLLHGALGTLVDPHDSRQLANRLTDLLRQRHPLPAESGRLREATIQNFGAAAFQNRLRQLLEGTCAA
jgi:glycosyltransferase involved in cell wall biosynthesis